MNISIFGLDKVPVAQNVNKASQYAVYKSDYDDVADEDEGDNEEGEEQTHGKTSRFRNVATLFILPKWTLRNSVAPEQESVVAREGSGGWKVIRAMRERK